jgi:hypothetical protein
MSSQPSRQSNVPERPAWGEVRPPAPGRAYFGYPQPSQAQFPVPKQQAPVQENSRPVEQALPKSVRDLIAELSQEAPRRPVVVPAGRPFRAHSRGNQSRLWPHLIGYPLAVLLGALLGAAGGHHPSTTAEVLTHSGAPSAIAPAGIERELSSP